MANISNIINDREILSPNLVPPLARDEWRRLLDPVQKLRLKAKPKVWHSFLSRAALYGTGAIFIIGIAVAFLFAFDAGKEFPVSFLSESHGFLVDKFMLGRDNLAMVVFDLTVMATSICFIFVLPDIHGRSRSYLDTPLISPRRAFGIKWGSYGGVSGLIVGIGGSFASRLAPSASTIKYLGNQDLASLGLAPLGSPYLFLGPQDLAFLGFAAAGVFFGILGLLGISFISRRVAKGMIAIAVITCLLVGIKTFLQAFPAAVTIVDWGLFIGTVAWMAPFSNAYLNGEQDFAPENTGFAGTDSTIQKTLWALGISSRQQLACEDSQELGAILGVPASLVDQWKGGTSKVLDIFYPELSCPQKMKK